MIDKYNDLLKQHQRKYTHYHRHYNALSWFRLLTILAAGLGIYLYLHNDNSYFLVGSLILFLLFFVLMRRHQKIAYAQKIEKIQIQINQDEIAFLQNNKMPFDNGTEFRPKFHFYANDLDLFGEKSLFHHLNRTGTFTGKKTLANQLLKLPSPENILPTQDAIKELSDKINWRQEILALAIYANGKQSDEENLKNWAEDDNSPIPLWLNITAYILPVLFVTSIILSFIPKFNHFSKIGGVIFTLNLILSLSQLKRMQKILTSSDKIDEIIEKYAAILSSTLKQNFQSEKLKSLQKQLYSKGTTADKQLLQLSSLFGKMDSLQNVFALILLNGFFQFHLHIFRNLLKWKLTSGKNIENWLDLIGQIEMLNSLANFAYNNKGYAYPTITTKKSIIFKNISHPLLPSQTRVSNDISFVKQKFIILTGSNMSGKSTFLRTLGINMVLARMGSVICAEKAEIYPLDILVSMRLNDSLNDSESYFFAEVKRLKLIIDELEKKACFVLLDEILRGTNSDDKRNGTIGYVRKLVQKNTIGIVATHDLEVCSIRKEYLDYIENYYFDAGILNDELYFDYTLKKGICQSKSASFLMKKLGILD